jgi:hypothetical protein
VVVDISRPLRRSGLGRWVGQPRVQESKPQGLGITQGLAYLPEFEVVGVEVIEGYFVLVLDEFPEDTDFGILRDVDLEHLMVFIPEHPAVEGVLHIRHWWMNLS